MEIRSVTFYFEGFEIDKNQALKLLKEYADSGEDSEEFLHSCIEDLCYNGMVDIPNKGIVSVVTEVLGIPDDFDFEDV